MLVVILKRNKLHAKRLIFFLDLTPQIDQRCTWI